MKILISLSMISTSGFHPDGLNKNAAQLERGNAMSEAEVIVEADERRSSSREPHLGVKRLIRKPRHPGDDEGDFGERSQTGVDDEEDEDEPPAKKTKAGASGAFGAKRGKGHPPVPTFAAASKKGNCSSFKTHSNNLLF